MCKIVHIFIYVDSGIATERSDNVKKIKENNVLQTKFSDFESFEYRAIEMFTYVYSSGEEKIVYDLCKYRF